MTFKGTIPRIYDPNRENDLTKLSITGTKIQPTIMSITTLNTKEDVNRANGYRATGSHRLQAAYTNASQHFIVGDYGAQDGENTAITHGDLA